MIIAVLGEKGGTGKTTVAVNLAGMRAAAGWRVLLLDGDRQGSSAYWAQKRETLDLPALHWDQYFGASLGRALQSATLDYDDVIVDIGAGDSDVMSAALEVADCAITPVRPSGIDVWTMGLMDSRMLDARLENKNLRCWAVINCASTHPASPDVAHVREALAGADLLKVAETVIRQRVVFQRAVAAGMTVVEEPTASQKAIDEIMDLYSLVFNVRVEAHERVAV